MLNDGTAMVMFAVMQGIVEGEGGSPVGIGLFFCQLSLGGPILGFVWGSVMSFWLSRIVNQPILEINITLFGAYLLFYTAESILHVSGILAMVALGLYMTKSGKTKISSVSEHAVHHVWSFVGFCAETMIFLLTGNIIAIQVFKEDSVIGMSDWWKLAALYFLLNML